ncbi:MAG: hypothetical protein EBE86_022435 [Hormoscilla sp. GUM202]|nr:hypothetical protein [Hormoscilla sp. GUM202]
MVQFIVDDRRDKPSRDIAEFAGSIDVTLLRKLVVDIIVLSNSKFFKIQNGESY